jgi:quinol monooxygenase YgiN
MTEFNKIVGQLIAAAKNEAGTLAYEFSIDADQSIVPIFERYRNSDAIVSHVTQTFGPFAERFLAAAQVRSFVVYGTPSNGSKGSARRLQANLHDTFQWFHALGEQPPAKAKIET